jgi:microcystin-dependent protein
MVSLKHLFQSGKADGTDVTLVKPTNWNEEHKFETAADSVVLGRTTGAGPGPVQELPLTSIFPPGMIMPYAGTGTPVSWLRCEGQVLNRADYDPLFQAISIYFNIGGETAAQFRLPDLRGRVVMGVDAAAAHTSAAWYPGGNPAVLGSGGGAQFEQALIPQVHMTLNAMAVTGTVTGVTVSGTVYGDLYGSASAGGGSGAGNNFVAGTPFGMNASGTMYGGGTWTMSSGSGSGYLDPNAYTGAQTNIPPALTLYYLIKT